METVHVQVQEDLLIVIRNVRQPPTVTSVMAIVKGVSVQDDVISTLYAGR